eukprot:c12149_g1_i1.p1 GENE.c12149_g1_i1~~c12149_g1_i1.p1  ORF type:complete len:255 (+),score=92.49 c12149_g1_i1:711-1475(+)
MSRTSKPVTSTQETVASSTTSDVDNSSNQTEAAIKQQKAQASARLRSQEAKPTRKSAYAALYPTSSSAPNSARTSISPRLQALSSSKDPTLSRLNKVNSDPNETQTKQKDGRRSFNTIGSTASVDKRLHAVSQRLTAIRGQQQNGSHMPKAHSFSDTGKNGILIDDSENGSVTSYPVSPTAAEQRRYEAEKAEAERTQKIEERLGSMQKVVKELVAALENVQQQLADSHEREEQLRKELEETKLLIANKNLGTK